MTIDQEFRNAIQLHQAGRLREARAAYQRLLSRVPNHVESLHYLGILLCQTGKPDAGVELIKKAIALKPDAALYHNNLGTALKSCGRLEDAANAYCRSIEINPNDPMPYCNLGAVQRDLQRPQEAADACRQALSLKPDYAEAYNNLGNALKDQGHLEDAIAAYRQGISFRPEMSELHNNLGSALISQQSFKEATDSCGKAIKLNPAFADAFINLGIALNKLNQYDQAITALRRAIELVPDSKEAHNNLGFALAACGMIDEALVVRRRAVELQPESVIALNCLGNVWMDMGEFHQAIECYRTALKFSPELSVTWHNLIMGMNYDPDVLPDQVRVESERWNRHCAEPMQTFKSSHGNDRDPNRRLRIGYVSADFHEHPVGRFILPVLASHNRSGYEIFCYSLSRSDDAVNKNLRTYADCWRSIIDMTDEQAAQLVRDAAIDILVDLSGHTVGNRLLLFARKPAPIQVTYLGYPATTGLSAMDYRITDYNADPPGVTDSFCTEKLIRLPRVAWCFRPTDNVPEVSALPADTTGKVTFGSFNSFFKLNQPLLILWANLLRLEPNSRLLLKAKGLEHASLQRKVERIMLEEGIQPDRLDLRGRVSIASHLRTYSEVDIALDTYPYHGTTTTCEALYMGVPVVTLAGQSHVSRVGVSLLSNTGLSDLVADDQRQYVKIASELALDLARLRELRQALRQRMRQSPLMNEAQFASDLESAYRGMWKAWCESGK